jgi:hypothetical protein
MPKKKQKTISKVVPDNVITTDQGKWFFDGLPLDVEMIDQIASEAEIFKNTYLYKFWQGYVRTSTITSIIKDSKDFQDVQNGKALLIALDRLDNMMTDIIKQQKKIVKNKN